jgi:SAM-dependent methyltransferase
MDHILEWNLTSVKSESRCFTDGSPLTPIIDLGMQPYADTFVPKERYHLNEPILPLEVGLCPKCGLARLLYDTEEDDRYNLFDYSYTSSNSDFSRSHWDSFAEEMVLREDIDARNVLEIGSNDGYLLKRFMDLGSSALGVDASRHMVSKCNDLGIDALSGTFSSGYVNSNRNRLGEPTLIVANNVLNHSNNPVDFLLAARSLLAPNSRLVFEVPYWANTVKDGKFDQIYHEHVSYFTISNLKAMLKECDLKILSLEIVDYHGGSLRVVCGPTQAAQRSPYEKLEQFEQSLALSDEDTYVKYQLRIKRDRSKMLQALHSAKLSTPESKVIGLGAAAKGNTLLNYYGLTGTLVDFVTDSSPDKKGKYTPMSRIPILGDDEIAKFGTSSIFFVLSWNIRQTLVSQAQQLAGGEIRLIN